MIICCLGCVNAVGTAISRGKQLVSQPSRYPSFGGHWSHYIIDPLMHLMTPVCNVKLDKVLSNENTPLPYA